MKRFIPFLLAATLLMLLTGGNLHAQATASANIQGTVTDKTQATIAGAQVTARNKGTDMVRTTTTSDAGYYRFELLPIGFYIVTVTKTGFATTTETVEVQVGQTVTVNAELQVGATSQVIEVTSEAPLMEQERTSVSQNITPREVEQLPLLGRDVANLAYLAPGVKATDSYDPTKNRYAILSVNGSNGRNVNVTVNGIDNKDNTVGGPVMQLPLEAVQEFQISTQRFSAQNGRSEGAAINMITKQGTNDYHGSFFSYFRESALDTDQQVPNGDGTSSPQHPDYTRQFFGGSIGGPIAKNKLFGFFALERERESQGLAEDTTSYNELVIAKNAGFAAQPATVIPRPFYEYRYNGRMDWTINNNNNAYISYTSQANNSLNDQSSGTADLTNGNYTKNHLQIANLTVNSILPNNAVNQFTFGFQYWNNLIDSNISAPLITFPDAQFGTNTNVPQQSFQRKWQFKDDVSKVVGKHTLKAGVDYIWNPVEGGFFEFSSTLEMDFTLDPSVIIANPSTCGPLKNLPCAPEGFATPGLVNAMTIANGDPYFLVATKQLGLYFQDDYKVSRRLSLNLGVRWDKDFNMYGSSDVAKSRTYQELVTLNSPVSNPWVSKIPSDDNKDVSPRVGFAYDLTGAGKHVVRGGYGLYFGNTFQNIPLFMEQMSNPTVFQAVISLSAPGDIVTGTGIALGNWRYGVDPLPTIPPPSTQLATLSVGRLMDPNYRNPVTEEFNLGYSWAITPNSVFEAEYTHVLGLHENKTMNIDQKVPVDGVCCTRPLDPYFTAYNAANPTSPLSQLASVRVEEAIGRSHYDGYNFSYRQRLTHHLSLNANYTLAWAYSYDSGGGSFRNYPALSTNPFASYDWGPSPNDERHHITVSGLYEMPWGLQLSPILQFGSARPYNLINSGNTLNTGGGTLNAVVVPTNNPTDWFAFAGNNTGAQNCFYGLNGVTQACTIAKYDPLRGDPFFELDLKLAKNIKLGEHVNLQLVAQAFNLTNRANYGNNFGLNIGSAATFGHPVGFINPDNALIPRSLVSEFGFHLTF
ncbi:MAG: carboxypeptidase regulatory-like domain-containing protein [Candidatus Acidiferrum sp.]